MSVSELVLFSAENEKYSFDRSLHLTKGKTYKSHNIYLFFICLFILCNKISEKADFSYVE